MYIYSSGDYMWVMALWHQCHDTNDTWLTDIQRKHLPRVRTSSGCSKILWLFKHLTGRRSQVWKSIWLFSNILPQVIFWHLIPHPIEYWKRSGATLELTRVLDIFSLICYSFSTSIIVLLLVNPEPLIHKHLFIILQCSLLTFHSNSIF